MFPLASTILTTGWIGKGEPTVASTSSVAKASFAVSFDVPPVTKGSSVGGDENPDGVGELFVIPIVLEATSIPVSASTNAIAINKYFLFVDN